MHDKKLFLHIGKPKTGTSALQRFFSVNHDALAEKGILYPRTIQHSDGSHHVLNWIIEENNDHTQVVFDRLKAEIDGSDCPTVLISSEIFSAPKFQAHYIVGRTRNWLSRNLGFRIKNIRPVVYLRRQDDAFESEYNQRVKGFGFGQPITNMAIPLDYYFMLKLWEEHFGAGNITVRIYDKGRLPQGVIADFLSLMGVDMSDDFVEPASDANPPLPRKALQLVRLCNRAGLPEDQRNALVREIQAHFDSIAKPGEKVQHAMLSHEQKKAILDRYEESNRQVAAEYLNSTEPLFRPLEPSEGAVDDISLEEAVKILVKLWANRVPQ